jgi:hypothetical protein
MPRRDRRDWAEQVAGLLARIKAEANRGDVPHQSYMKMLLADALDERRRWGRKSRATSGG